MDRRIRQNSWRQTFFAKELQNFQKLIHVKIDFKKTNLLKVLKISLINVVNNMKRFSEVSEVVRG